MAEPRDDDKPQYTLYRARPKLFRRRSDDGGLREKQQEPAGYEAPPAEPRRRRRRTGPRRRIGVWRIVRWLVTALVAWLLVSLILFLVSAQIQSANVSDAADTELGGGGYPLTSPNTILVLGSDARPKGSKEAGANKIGQPSRADSILLMRIGGGSNATLSIPRDTVVDIPGHGQNKINAAYALGGPELAIRTVEQYLGLQVNHLVEVNFENFPQLIDALGGVDYRGGCVLSRINGGFKNGGYTLRLKGGEQEINGKQALALARTRKNECNPRENDLTRARRQQKILGSIKDKVSSFETFVRLPWVAWAAPKAIRSDMSGPSLLGLVGAELTAGTAKPTVLRPSGGVVLPDGGQGLTVDDATKQSAVARFLRGLMRWYAVGAAAAAVVLALAYGPSYLGYDAAWALVWGGELADGKLPSYEVAFAPTPHPLANLVAIPLSLFGADDALRWLTFAAFGALVSGAWALGAEIGGMAGGAVAALLVATRSDLGREAAFASVDLPFLALVIWAIVATARRGPASALPLALLVPAGLLRPEAWGLSLAALAWAAATGGAPLRRLAALAFAAPALWLLSDLAVTGDPLHSLHGTRELAAQLDRPRGAGTAIAMLDDGLGDVTGGLAVLAGLVGAALAVWLGRRRPALIACAAAALGVAGFVAIGAAGLPVLFRYLLIPATLLLVLAGGGFGASARRSPAAAGALVIAALLAASVPSSIDDLDEARAFTQLRAEVHGDLLAVTRAARFREAAERCGPVFVPGFRARPFVLLGGDADVRVGNLADGERGVLVTYADELSELVFNLGAPGEAQRQSAPLNSRPLAGNPSWRSYSVC